MRDWERDNTLKMKETMNLHTQGEKWGNKNSTLRHTMVKLQDITDKF